MILRIVLITMILLGLSGFGAVAWVMLPRGGSAVAVAPPVVNRLPVLTLARPLRAGAVLKQEDLVTADLDQASLPAGYVADTAEARRGAVGSAVRRALVAGEVLRLPADALRPTDHGFLAAVLTPGTRAVTVGVDMVSGAAGLIWPGDRVDLVLTQKLEDPGLAPGRRIAAETVLRDVRVIAIDQQVGQSEAAAPAALPATPDALAKDAATQQAIGTAKTVTLEVTPEKGEFVQVAARLGQLSLALRAADAGPGGPATAATVWASDVSAALPTQTMHPATTGLRVFQGAADAKEFKF